MNFERWSSELVVKAHEEMLNQESQSLLFSSLYSDFPFSSTDSISSSSVIDKSRERINAKTPKRPHDGKPQVLDSALKYCEPIGQK